MSISRIIHSHPMFFIYIISGFLSLGCTHTNAKRLDRDSQVGSENLSKLLPKEEDTPTQNIHSVDPSTPQTKVAPTEESLKDFLNRAKIEAYSWNEADEDLLASIQETPKQSLSEASLIIGLCFKSQETQSPDKQNPLDSFQEEDIANETQAQPKRNTVPSAKNLPPASIPYFDNLINQHSIDLNAAIRENPFLKDETLRRVIRSAIMEHSFSLAFKDEHLATLAITQNDGGTSAAEVTNSQNSDFPTNSSDEISFASLQNNDDKIALAQSYALDKNFEKAIEVITSIQTPELRETSSELLRIYSNQGVNLLRQKAALAFQEALSSGNSEQKKNHLESAKTLLQQALEKYPNSDQSKVIQDNLDIVSRDIANLNL